jgi:hypothetical protein
VKAKAVEGLLDRMIPAKVSLTAKALTTLCTSKLAYRHREAVYKTKLSVTVSLLDELLPKGFFDFPQIGSLPNEGSAMDKSQSRKEMREVAAEVVEQGLVLAESKILTDYLDSKDLAVSKPRLRPTLAQSLMAEKAVESIVNKTKHSYNESIQVQGKRPPIDGLAISIESASPWTFNFNLKTCTSRY